MVKSVNLESSRTSNGLLADGIEGRISIIRRSVNVISESRRLNAPCSVPWILGTKCNLNRVVPVYRHVPILLGLSP
ncbi:hypothetical protein KM043_002065 [Ampulex compressa]|nr:hypothetical protein KM043_002065 [Ampulex compressa]